MFIYTENETESDKRIKTKYKTNKKYKHEFPNIKKIEKKSWRKSKNKKQ